MLDTVLVQVYLKYRAMSPQQCYSYLILIVIICVIAVCFFSFEHVSPLVRPDKMCLSRILKGHVLFV